MKKSIFVKFNNAYQRINIEDIDWLMSEGNYVTIFVGDKKYVIKWSLSQMKSELPENDFVQIHKRYIINMDKIERLNLANNQIMIVNTPLPIGRTFKNDLIERLNLL